MKSPKIKDSGASQIALAVMSMGLNVIAECYRPK
jgi:hypothetical protein